MTKIKRIKNTAKHVVIAISAAIGVEVALIDSDFKLIATSKTFLGKKSIKMNKTYLKKVYEKGIVVLSNPGYHEFCKGCECEGKCPQTAEVDHTIVFEGEIIGVILMVAYTSEQRDRLLNHTNELLEFLGEMANLLCNEIKLQELLRQETMLKSHLETTINFVDSGIITTNRVGSIAQINSQAAKILNVKKSHALGMNLQDILSDDGIKQLLDKGDVIKEQEFLSGTKDTIHCLVSGNPAIVRGKIVGGVFSIKDIREVRSTIYEFSEKNIACTFEDIYGESEPMRRVKKDARRMASADSTILIQGESGTGKELFARAIHSHGKRFRYPFIPINCAAIPENLLESELFGYDEGAFSGARKGGKPGKFERASGGTVFLDEIGDMPLHMQVKLLRVLQEQTIERVGGIKFMNIDVRIIAATNQDLSQMIKDRKFREDLFFRLNVLPLHIPPLRQRRTDIYLLTKVFIEKYNHKICKSICGFDDDAMETLISYYWPGNVRELENTIEYSVNMETEETIKKNSLPASISTRTGLHFEKNSLVSKLREYEKLLILEALEASGQTVKGKKIAAKELGVSLPTLYRRIKELCID